MDRRTALKTAAIVAGAGLTLSSREMPQIESVTALFRRDWGTGPPVVFGHGWALNSDFWQYQMLHLVGRGFRCVAYDRRGHGRTGDPGRGYDYDTLAGDLAGLLDHLDLRDATLVGHSMGCGEVVRYLSLYGPKRVARVVLVGATLPFLLKTANHPEGVPRTYFDAWRKAVSTDFPKWRSENEAPFWMPETSEQMKEWGRHLPLQCSLQAAVETTYTLTETDFRNELRAIKVPALLVHGTEDRSIPVQFARRTAQLIPRCRLEEYVGAPHGLPLTHMERFNQELTVFLKS
jgi:pimeloyl-ACP methyl ester carboxylesterase